MSAALAAGVRLAHASLVAAFAWVLGTALSGLWWTGETLPPGWTTTRLVLDQALHDPLAWIAAALTLLGLALELAPRARPLTQDVAAGPKHVPSASQR